MWLSPPHLVNLSISFIGVTATNNLGMSWWLCEVCTYSYCTSMYFHSYSNKSKNIMLQVIVYIHQLVSAYPNGAKNQSYINGDLFTQSIWYKMLNFSIGLICTHTTVHFTWAVVAQLSISLCAYITTKISIQYCLYEQYHTISWRVNCDQQHTDS